ncbi:hypothetical protein [Streptomyces iconiensis]|uniref:Uncharacterized protein n=1 Tax=Streptomyces iconiensis TaxID=1384038 RepID=A0ABT7A9A5_9ACTN|nr:hypothetical protein [Streptomyces iconiensis]MDJ1137622.1 hypothetical protein [Streptomyces iconiensis]
MSRSAEIEFAFSGAIRVGAALDALEASGVDFGFEERVTYVIDEGCTFDWSSAPAEALQKIKEVAEKAKKESTRHSLPYWRRIRQNCDRR